MRRALVAAVLLVVLAGGSAAGEPVADYEARLDAIAGELGRIRRDLERLVDEVAWAGMGEVFVFLESAPGTWAGRPLQVRVDGTPVFSRALGEAEREILARGLPVELVRLSLAAGEHRVWIGPAGTPPDGGERFRVEAAGRSAWIAAADGQGVRWRAE